MGLPWEWIGSGTLGETLGLLCSVSNRLPYPCSTQGAACGKVCEGRGRQCRQWAAWAPVCRITFTGTLDFG